MSRIGKQPIEVPQGADVTLDGQGVLVKGPKGELSLRRAPGHHGDDGGPSDHGDQGVG